jgi:hypothetical protein
MPTKHSKNASDRHHLTYGEKRKNGIGSISQRLGSDSQLPFGYCPLSLVPIDDAVVSPSGHIYSISAYSIMMALYSSSEMRSSSLSMWPSSSSLGLSFFLSFPL